MPRPRWWISLAIVIATLLASGPHHHARDEIAATLRPEEGCADECPHYAGHEALDLDAFDIDCVACHFRSEPRALSGHQVPFFQHRTEDRLDPAPPVSSIRLVTRSTSRAPPGVPA